jgi:hypothetical protein
MFFLGQRERNAQIERTGTIVLKRSYQIDRAAHTIAPASESAVLTRDYPDNLVVNGDFELSRTDLGEGVDATQPGAWQVSGLAAFAPAAGVGSARGLSIAAGSTISQAISFDQPLGGRTFTLSLYARTDGAAPLSMPVLAELVLEDPDAGKICVVTGTLDGTMRRRKKSSRWPATVTATKARLVIHGAAAAAGVTVDRVQLEERRTMTRWDPETILRYESDLAPYKPEADLIVLGYDGARTATDVSASVDGQPWLARTIPAGENEKAAFGWESRADPGPRKTAVGVIPASPPPPTLLPHFDNAFYNGFRRDSAVGPRPFVVPDAASEIDLKRGTRHYYFRLRGDVASATLSVQDGGADDPSRWRRSAVDMMLDTIVIEPDHDRCAVVWRGAWAFDDAPIESYRALTVNASA